MEEVIVSRPYRPQKPQVFATLFEAFGAHPELRDFHRAMQEAALAPCYSSERHARAKAAWAEACAIAGVRFRWDELLQPGLPAFGHAAHVAIPDPDEPGFEPADLTLESAEAVR